MKRIRIHPKLLPWFNELKRVLRWHTESFEDFANEAVRRRLIELQELATLCINSDILAD